MVVTRSLAATLLLAWSRLSLAQGPVVSATAPAPAPPPATDVAEPHADRVVLVPTAYTHPRGTWYVSSYDLVVLQVGYALTDRTQVSFTTTPPIGEDDEARLAAFDLSLKTNLAREGLVRAAAMASISGLAGDEIGLMTAGRLGGVVQLCLRIGCESSFSVASNLLMLGPVLVMSNGVGAILRAGRRFSFLLEADTVLPLGREGGQINGFGAGGGVRLHFSRFAMDVAMLVAMGDDEGALPIVALTYRTRP